MRAAVIISAFICICIIQASAADSNSSQQGASQHIEQKKTEMLLHIQERITNSQAEIACVKAAESHDGLIACREKYRPPRPENEQHNRHSNQ